MQIFLQDYFFAKQKKKKQQKNDLFDFIVCVLHVFKNTQSIILHDICMHMLNIMYIVDLTNIELPLYSVPQHWFTIAI